MQKNTNLTRQCRESSGSCHRLQGKTLSLGHVPWDYVPSLGTHSSFGEAESPLGEPFPSPGLREPWVQHPEGCPTAFFRPQQQKIEPCSRIPDPSPGPKREPSRSAGLTKGIRFVLHRVVHLPGHPGHRLAHLFLHAGARSRRGRASAGGIHGWRKKPASPASQEGDAKNNQRDQRSRGREGGRLCCGWRGPQGMRFPDFQDGVFGIWGYIPFPGMGYEDTSPFLVMWGTGFPAFWVGTLAFGDASPFLLIWGWCSPWGTGFPTFCVGAFGIQGCVPFFRW